MAALGNREPKGRTQVITPRAPRKLGRMGRSRRRNRLDLGQFGAILLRFGGPLSIIPVVVFCLVSYNMLTRSKLFAVRNVHVIGASQAVAGTVEQTVRKATGSTRLLDVSLPSLRSQVEALPRVRSASVSRTLPDTISVDVTERQAALLVKRDSGQIVWMDSDAVDLGDDPSLTDSKDIPPVVTGFAEGARSKRAVADDLDRIAKYMEIKREFEDKSPSIWNLIGQIDLAYSDQGDVNVWLAHPWVSVHLGVRDYRHRMDAALMVLDALKKGDVETLHRFHVEDAERYIAERDNLKTIEAARPEHVVMTFSGGYAMKPGKQESLVGKPPGKRRR